MRESSRIWTRTALFLTMQVHRLPPVTKVSKSYRVQVIFKATSWEDKKQHLEGTVFVSKVSMHFVQVLRDGIKRYRIRLSPDIILMVHMSSLSSTPSPCSQTTANTGQTAFSPSWVGAHGNKTLTKPLVHWGDSSLPETVTAWFVVLPTPISIRAKLHLFTWLLSMGLQACNINISKSSKQISRL